MSHLSRPRSTSALAALLTGLTLAAAGCGDDETGAGGTTPGKQPSSAPKGKPAEAVRAIDGDTLDVKLDGKTERVRLLGIDAPESTTKRNGKIECGGAFARGAMKSLVARSPKIEIAFDPSQDERDQYGRLLAYVTSETGGTTWQEQLLNAGWAEVYEQRGEPILLDEEFRKATASAEEAEAGVFQICGGDFHKPEQK
ncbi:MAG: thermonuclease family protein [Solirubrobacteraceae bacterium]|nr:thermonuclease family protein [Solirubrobacteraceae bacterium]